MHSLEEYIEKEFAEDMLKDGSAKVKIIKRYSEGKSGANVFLLDILEGKSINGKYILKADIEKNEKENYGILSYSKNHFCKEHLLPLVIPAKEVHPYNFLIMSTAGQNMDLYEEMYKLVPKKQRELARYVSKDLLNDLNKEFNICEDQTAFEILNSLLGSKLKTGGILYTYLSELTNNFITYSSFSIYDHILPNPYFYATCKDMWCGEKKRTVKGMVYGDLHGLNIFSNKDSLENYYLIDVANFNSNSFIFFDNAYLEISFLLDYSDKIPLKDWFYLVNGIVEKSEDNLTSYSLDLFEFASVIQSEEIVFIEKNYKEIRISQ